MSGAGRIAGLPSSLRVHSLRLVPGEEIKSSLLRSVLKSLFCIWIFGVGTFGQFTISQFKFRQLTFGQFTFGKPYIWSIYIW